LAGALDARDNLQNNATREATSGSKGSVNKPRTPCKASKIEAAVEAFLETERKKVDAGLMASGSYQRREIALRIHLIAYLKYKGITDTTQIDHDTFEDYTYFRRDTMKYTRKKELAHIKHFVKHYLTKHNLIKPEVAMYGGLVPTVRMKQSDFDANPAINEGDWRRINLYIRREYLQVGAAHSNYRVHHWRYLMWTFTIVMKNTGARPNELRKLRWKDVEIENIGRWSESKQEMEDRFIAYLTLYDDKTQAKREVPANVGEALLRWMKYRLSYIKNHMPHLFDKQGANLPDQLVFGNPANDFKAYAPITFQHSWREIINALHGQLKGHKFSDRPYTIYSMRSTFIEDKLLEGMDIFLLARLCGHSVKVLMTHYERLDIRKRAEEITHIDYGKTKKKMRIVDVLTN
jgi:integrase